MESNHEGEKLVALGCLSAERWPGRGKDRVTKGCRANNMRGVQLCSCFVDPETCIPAPLDSLLPDPAGVHSTFVLTHRASHAFFSVSRIFDPSRSLGYDGLRYNGGWVLGNAMSGIEDGRLLMVFRKIDDLHRVADLVACRGLSIYYDVVINAAFPTSKNLSLSQASRSFNFNLISKLLVLHGIR